MSTKKQSLSEVVKELNKKYGAQTITTVDKKENTILEVFSTNCYSLDKVFGVGGIPKGRILDVSGQPSSGKSTMAMFIVAQIQKQGGVAVWVDTEFSFTSDYAKKVGVDTSKLLLVQPDNGEISLNILEQFVSSGEVDIIVLDSTGAIVPSKEIDGDIEDHNIALQARMMSKVLRVITPAAAKNKTTVLFISQLRQKIGAFSGPTTAPTGGLALRFYTAVRLDVARIKTLKKGDEVIGNRLRITATKNKVGKPFRSADIDLYFEKGIDVVGDLLDVATDKKIVAREGNTYSYAKQKLGVGRNDAIDYLEKNVEILEKIKEQLMLGEEK